MRGRIHHKPDFASRFQQAHDRALHAVFGENAVDEAFTGVQFVEQPRNVRIAEYIEVVFLDENLSRSGGQQRGRRLPLPNRPDHAMRRPDLELARVLRMRAHRGNQRDAAFARMMVQRGDMRNYPLSTGSIQRSGGEDEIDLGVDVEECLHAASSS